MARTYALPLSTVVTWRASDVLAAAWALARARYATQYESRSVALYAGHLTAAAFNAPERLADAQAELQTQAPAWDRTDVAPIPTGTMDDLFALMGRPPE